MSLAQYALNLGLLGYVLLSNLGTHAVTHRRLALPVVLVAVAAVVFLRDMPTVGNDARLELIGLGAGALLGLIAGLLVSVRRTPAGPVMVAGGAYAALWIVVIVGRMAFAYGADHWFTRWIGTFSYRHQITGADAWTAGFILMALAMVLVRVGVTTVATVHLRRSSAPLSVGSPA